MKTSSPAPVAFLADWGTTALRLWAVDASGRATASGECAVGAVSVLSGPGIESGPTRDQRFVAVIADLAGPVFSGNPGVPLVICGMAGSRDGWRDTGYMHTPARLTDIGKDVTSFAVADREIHIVPGLLQRETSELSLDVMRGEETQIVGVSLSSAEQAEDYTIVLPGTHTKWVQISSGTITSFSTSMTGDLFSAVRGHTVLSSPHRAHATGSVDSFERGLETGGAQGISHGLAATLFSGRTKYLTGNLSATEIDLYISGMLIGDEVAHQLPRVRDSSGKIILCGAGPLAELYRRALQRAGASPILADTGATVLGLHEMAARLDIVAHPASATDKEPVA